MNGSKLVAIITGAIALFLGIGYLVLVQFLDFRGEMVPAPQDLSLELIQPGAIQGAIATLTTSALTTLRELGIS